jgi:uncharacterized protein YprB with RNaseH-like and TPR domain
MVPLDIETTGFAISDEVTVLGVAMPLGCRVFVQTGEQSALGQGGGSGSNPGGGPDRDRDASVGPVDATALEDAVRERTGRHVVVSTHATERDVLVAVWEFVGDRLAGDDVLLVGYNAETWQGGFDLPFLRSRCAAQNVPWLFGDLPYADLLPVVSDRFNTTLNGDARSDLESAYAALCDGDLNDIDPFADSQEAAPAFQNGEFVPLVTHNVADILRTGALGTVARQYCSKSDFSLKSLTPVIDDA